MKVLFLHGWNSVVGGVKPTFLKDHGHEVINPALPHEDFAEAVRIAQAEFDKHRPQVIVGSSRGGAVAMNTAEQAVAATAVDSRKFLSRQAQLYRSNPGSAHHWNPPPPRCCIS